MSVRWNIICSNARNIVVTRGRHGVGRQKEEEGHDVEPKGQAERGVLGHGLQEKPKQPACALQGVRGHPLGADGGGQARQEHPPQPATLGDAKPARSAPRRPRPGRPEDRVLCRGFRVWRGLCRRLRRRGCPLPRQ